MTNQCSGDDAGTAATEQLPQPCGLAESIAAAVSMSESSAKEKTEQSSATEQLPQPCESSTEQSSATVTWQAGLEPSSTSACESEPSGMTNSCEPLPPPPFLLVTGQTVPFQSVATNSNEETEAVALASPRSASSSAADKSSAMYFSVESTGILLHPVSPAPQGQNASEELDEMTLISAFHEALSMACKAGKVLQVRCEESLCEIEGAHLEERSECYQQSKDFTKKYAELKRYEQHLKGAYERECDLLKEQLRAMASKQKENDRDHEIEILKLGRKHCEETRQLKEKVVLKEEFQSLQQKQADVAKLRKLKKLYRDGCKEAEDLCTRLAEKEKSLHTLRCQIENLELTLKRHLLSVDADHIKQQLQTCRQIEKMVERLPNVSGTGIDKLVGEISAEVEKMRSLSTNKRSTSWRR